MAATSTKRKRLSMGVALTGRIGADSSLASEAVRSTVSSIFTLKTNTVEYNKKRQAA
jgi:hypothetical protein